LIQNRLNRPQSPIFDLLLKGKLVDRCTGANTTLHTVREEIRNQFSQAV